MATTTAGMSGGTQVNVTDLPAWYQQYTQNLGAQAMSIAQGNNTQALPWQSIAGFNPDQLAAFQNVRNDQGFWRNNMGQAASQGAAVAPTAAKFVDYAQGAVGGPAMETGSSVMPWAQGAQDAMAGSSMETGSSVMPWAQGAQDAMAGSSQNWIDTGKMQQYMSPYTQSVVDNIGRMGKRNWEESIMPGVNSSMIGAGQFGSTRNADILGRAGVKASDDITGQQSNALQAGYSTAAGIFANDANRAQQQQQLQSQAALSGGNLMQSALGADANRAQQQQQLQSQAALAGGNLMQGALGADANRMQQQQQLQANTALQGANTAISALTGGANSIGALSQLQQGLQNSDFARLMGIGDAQQQLQQNALNTAYQNAMFARQDPWTQLGNAASIMNNIKLPSTSITTSSGQVGSPPTTANSLAALLAALSGSLK